MSGSSKGCNSYSDVMDRIVRDPFKDGMVGRSYEEFLVHNHVQPAYRESSDDRSDLYFYSTSIGQGPAVCCPETVTVDWWNPHSG